MQGLSQAAGHYYAASFDCGVGLLPTRSGACVYRPLTPLLLLAGAAQVEMAAVENQQLEVGEVRVEGTKRIHPDRVIFRLRTREGTKLDPTLLARDVRAIAEAGPFIVDRVLRENMDDGRIRVVFQLKELPYIGSIDFTGLSWFKRQGLK